MRNNLIVQGHENRKELLTIEKRILKELSKTEGNILDDE